MNIEATMRQVNAACAKARVDAGQLTLGRLIDELDALPRELFIRIDSGHDPGRLNSYRGYYDQLALSCDSRPKTVGELLAECLAADGAVMTGYKGGDYRMKRETHVYVSDYGEASGNMIVAVEVRDGIAMIITRAEES